MKLTKTFIDPELVRALDAQLGITQLRNEAFFNFLDKVLNIVDEDPPDWRAKILEAANHMTAVMKETTNE